MNPTHPLTELRFTGLYLGTAKNIVGGDRASLHAPYLAKESKIPDPVVGTGIRAAADMDTYILQGIKV